MQQVGCALSLLIVTIFYTVTSCSSIPRGHQSVVVWLTAETFVANDFESAGLYVRGHLSCHESGSYAVSVNCCFYRWLAQYL